MNNDQTIYNLQPHYRLKIVDGIDAGKQFGLYQGLHYTIGRSKSCEIPIDASNIHASGWHAQLTVGEKSLILENLNKNNTTLVLGKAIDKASLKPGVQFQIDATVFVIEGCRSAEHKKPLNIKLLILSAALLLLLLLILIAFKMFAKSDTAPPLINKLDTEMVDTQNSGEDEMTTLPSTAPAAAIVTPQAKPETTTDSTTPDSTTPDSTTPDREKAAEHYQNGVFFYDAGNLGKAIDEWNASIDLDPENTNALNRLLKAEAENEELIDRHYQNGLLHKKYMRYREAVEEFTIVSEMSRNKDDERCKNSLKEIRELGGPLKK